MTKTKPPPQPLSRERGVICSPIVFYSPSISKAFYSPLLGEGLGVRLCFPLSFLLFGVGGEALFPLSFLLFGVGGEALFSTFLFEITI